MGKLLEQGGKKLQGYVVPKNILKCKLHFHVWKSVLGWYNSGKHSIIIRKHHGLESSSSLKKQIKKHPLDGSMSTTIIW